MWPNIRQFASGAFWLTLAVVPALRADVTLHYKSEVNLNPHLPAQAVEQMTKGMSASLQASQTQQLKNGKFLSGLANLS